MERASGTQPHYEAPGNLQIRYVIVSCQKLAFGKLIQIQVMGSASDKILNLYIYIYIYISNPQVYDIISWLNKNLKMHFVLYFYKRIRSDIETWPINRVYI